MLYSYSLNINGMYVADADFCNEANLSTLMIYFSNGTGYIFIQGDDGTILVSDVIEYKIYSAGSNYKIQFYGIENQDFFPSEQNIKYDAKAEKILLFSDLENLHARLYKNSYLSDIMSK